MYNRGYATAWETIRFPGHIQQVEPGDAIFMFAKGVGIIGIGQAKTKCETLKPNVFLEKISIDPPREKIYQRLGFKKRTTQISETQQEETDRFIQEASSLISLKGSLLRLAIKHNDGEKIILAGALAFTSKKLSAFLRNCQEAVFMAATAGSAIMEAIKEKTRQDDLAAAVVYDATASEMTDTGLDWIMDYLNQQIRREGKTLLPRRFSAGYADFNLENQKAIYEILQMGTIGVTITSSFILLPEKSVTAISGIVDNT